MKNSSYEIFLINPFVIKNNTDIFKNLILRSSINYFIFDNYAPLKKILTHIYPSFNIEKTYIYINFNEINNIKIIKNVIIEIKLELSFMRGLIFKYVKIVK